ncbi:GatB/YqeY domain-containing protein [Patescibacteria group bacterium]
MSLKEKIQEDLTTAMKAQESLKVSTLRMLKAEIMKFEVSGGAKKEASDEDVLTILQKQVKQRKDAAQQYKDGDRAELAQKEEEEAKILQEYLPEQMGEKELREIVKATIEEVGATSKADMGKVMGSVMGKTKGQADGKLVNKLVMELLP